MKKGLSLPVVRGYAGVVGAMDLATGLALLVAPAFTLARMGAVVPGEEALGYVRFAGVFVAVVGASYLVALGRGGAARLRGALEFTLLARAGAGAFAGIAVVAGLFDRAWLIVAATDLACAAAQGWMLAGGFPGDE
jgi:hypothetical protein